MRSGNNHPNATKGTLLVIATPIGNLEDITLRALRVLAEVDVLLAEDTRRIRRLLHAHHLPTPSMLISYFEGNEGRRVPQVIQWLEEGKTVGLVSDAGTPTLSDPGYRIVRAAREHNISVIPVPGPSAAIAALSVSGLPTDRFVFEGFLPRTSGKRRRRLESLQHEPRTVILYESVHRLEKTLGEIQTFLGNRRIFIAREMTKMHEEHFWGRVEDAREWAQGKKGEFVIVIGPSEGDPDA